MFPFWKLPVLVARTWRLCRELDDYDDVECAAFTRAVKSWRVLGLAIALPVAIVVGLGMTVAVSAWMPVESLEESTAAERALSLLVRALILLFAVSLAFYPHCIVVRWALEQQISRVACPSCRYSLLGHPSKDGKATCPECGRTIELAEHGPRWKTFSPGCDGAETERPTLSPHARTDAGTSRSWCGSACALRSKS